MSKKKEQVRRTCLERLIYDRGVQLRIHRSIQAESAFAIIKEDMKFRRYACHGKDSVLPQCIIMTRMFDTSRRHHKIQDDRTGTHFHEHEKSCCIGLGNLCSSSVFHSAGYTVLFEVPLDGNRFLVVPVSLLSEMRHLFHGIFRIIFRIICWNRKGKDQSIEFRRVIGIIPT